MTAQTPDPARTRKVLWLANLSAIMLFAVLILFLPGLVALPPVPEALTVLFVLALLSLPIAFLAGRLTGHDSRRGDIHKTQAEDGQKAVSRFAVAGTLAELPAMFGLVYALLGGDRFYALAFAAAALIATVSLRPD